MKQFFLFMALMGMVSFTEATTYYSQGSGVPQTLANWNTNRAGGGSSPLSFTALGDQFIIQAGHVISTNSSWTVGNTGSVLRVENGGILQASFPVLLTGTFHLDNGAYYYHDNTASVSSAAGASIFGGTEIFGASSTVEIRNWINNTTPLPTLNWGHLVINYSQSIGGNWNQQAALNSVQGNLIIKRTGTAGQDFRLTTNTNLTLTIGGNLEVEQGILLVKEGNAAGTSSLVQVNGGITVSQGTLDLGTADFKPNNELRWKGNLFVLGTGSITAQTEEAFLVANGTGAQTYYSETTLQSSFKVAKGTMIKLNTALQLSSLRDLVVAGSFIGGSYPLSFSGGDLIVSGGTFMSGGKINMRNGICQSCQGNGTFSVSTNWCAATGDTGVIYFSTDSIIFNRTPAALLRIGANGSKGKMFFTNNAVISFSGAGTGNGGVELMGNGTLSFDEFSYASGNAYYQGLGGWLVTGSPQGIQLTASTGSIRFPNPNPGTNNLRNYNLSGINNFEYNGSSQQFTGNGLPTFIAGVLRINNSSTSGVTLSGSLPYTIGATGNLQMVRGNLRTNSTTLMILNSGAVLSGGSALSYVDGPLRKFGNQDFTFPVGKQGRYAPVFMSAGGSGSVTDVYTVEYFPGNPLSVYDGPLFQFMDHLSSVEYWNITGTASARQVRFPIVPYSGITDFPTLVMGYWDGAGWLNAGPGTKTGTPSNGTLTISTNNFGPFTFASTSALTNHLSSLPVLFLGFEARRNGEQGVLDWQVSGPVEAEYFEVLTSTNNRDFVPVGRVMPRAGTQWYQALVALPAAQDLYCRIRAVEKSGAVVYSRTALIKARVLGAERMKVYPSVTRGSVTLQFDLLTAQTVQVAVYDAMGRRQLLRSLSANRGENLSALDLSALSRGTYIIEVITSASTRWVTRVIRE